ncbi:MAG: antitoxin VapB family protein [Candidatus Aenigmarchaeota archaeon]|nr:antitoxin VapB family protein [Candidatus Aenigmarchaeota archaeon]
MGFKTITIKEEVYKKLLRAKNNEESFSEFLDKTVSKRPNIERFYGAWKMSKKDAESIKKTIRKYREDATENFHERIKRSFR